MSNGRRISQSFTFESSISVNINPIPHDDTEEWIASWKALSARDLIDSGSRVVSVDADTSVEDACDILLSEDITCLLIKSSSPAGVATYTGLFDFSDVNAFLTLAATRHTLLPEDLRDNPRLNSIVAAAKAGRVPISLVSNLSEKDPFEVLPYDATVLSLLSVFSRGPHRVLIQGSNREDGFIGIVSDRQLLSWFASYANETPSLHRYLSSPLHSYALPSLNLYSSVISVSSSSPVLDAMKRMSEDGVSSVAVLGEETGDLLSAVSVTDIGKIVVPSQSNQILSMPLHVFISQIKGPDGSTDGIDKYPVYSVSPSSSMTFAIQKLLATNAHRLFVTYDSDKGQMSPMSSSAHGNLSGIISIVDVLSLFARLAKIPNVDPTRMQRHRRASSSSSHSSKSERDSLRSRSGSRTSIRTPSAVASPSHTGVDSAASSLVRKDSLKT